MIPVNNCRQGCAMPWQWGKSSCITLCSGVERQICFIMLHNGVRSFGAGQIYPTPASWQPCPQDKISKSTSDCAALISNTEKQILIPASSVALWISAGSGLFFLRLLLNIQWAAHLTSVWKAEGFSAIPITSSLSFSALNVSYRFTWLQLPHWSKAYIFVNTPVK